MATPLRTTSHELLALADLQDRLATRRQLSALGYDRHAIRRRIVQGQWQPYGAKVVVLQHDPPTRAQECRAATLHAGPRSALAGLTALEAQGLDDWFREPRHVVVPAGTHVAPMPGLVVHWSHRLTENDLVTVDGMVMTSPARSAVDAARWDRSPRTAAAVVIATVQQRLATPDQISHCLDQFLLVRQQVAVTQAVTAAARGNDSLSEADADELIRLAGFPEPVRQWEVDTELGRRFVDLAVPLGDGRFLVIEIDGPHHEDEAVRVVDAVKDAALVAAGHEVVRIPAIDVVRDRTRVLSELKALRISLLGGS